MEKENVNFRDYYKCLSKRDKSRFLLYLASKYGMSAVTVSRKMNNPDMPIKKTDIMAITDTIEKELWKR